MGYWPASVHTSWVESTAFVVVVVVAAVAAAADLYTVETPPLSASSCVETPAFVAAADLYTVETPPV